jgi:biopolymer transport protein ExbD
MFKAMTGGRKMKRKLIGIWVLLVFFSVGVPCLCRAGEIHLMFPKLEQAQTVSEGKICTVWALKETQEGREYSETKLWEFVKEFEKPGYEAEEIELWIEARVESEGVTKLFISMEGVGGCKVTLRPRSQ